MVTLPRPLDLGRTPLKPPLSDPVLLLGIAGVYFGAAKLGLSMASVADQVTAVWPPTGIALAAVLVLGSRAWPGIWLGAFLANATANEPLVSAAGIAIGNTLEAVAGAWLLGRVPGFRGSLDRVQDVLALVVLAAIGSTMLSATIGSSTLILTGVQPASAFRDLWWTWWVGDAIGDLIVGSVLLVWILGAYRPSRAGVAEALALIVSVLVATGLVFIAPIASWVDAGSRALAYIVFPLVIWGALRFGQRGATTVALLASGVAIWGTIHGRGPFAAANVHDSLLLLQLFMGVVAASGLFLAAAVAERGRADEAARLSDARLRMALTAARMARWDYDVLTGTVTWSEDLEAIHALPPGTFGNTFDAYLRDVHPDDRARVRQAIAGAIESGDDHDLEYRIVRPDGSLRWIHGRGRVLRDPSGRAVAMTGLCTDVTARKQAEDALRRSEADLADFFENASVGLHWVGPDGTILRANRAELELLGYTREEYVGRHIAEFHVDRAAIEDILERLSRGETVHDYEARLRCKDGSVKHVLVDSNVLWEDGRFVHTRSFTRDVTERKLAEALFQAQKRALELIARGTALPVVLELLARLIEQQSSGMLASILLLDGEKRLRHGAAPSLPATYTAALDGARIGPTAGSCGAAAHRRERVVTVDIARDPLWADYREIALAHGLRACWATPLSSSGGEVLGTFALYYREPRRPQERDLRLIEGAAHVARLAIERHRLEEERAAILARERHARGEAEAANRSKDQFLAMLGHELRNPLAAIVQAVTVLKDQRTRDGHTDHLQGIIARQARHLSKLVDDLLEVSRLTSGKIVLSPEPVDLFEIANRCVTAPALANRGVTLDGQSAWIEADPIRMEQVITNLLDNAAKYTPEGGRIAVSVGKQAGRAVLRVRDTGVGIPPELLSRIFDAFIQGGQTIDRSRGGLGLGLTVVDRLVELQGGTVTAHSEGPGRGSEFVVSLPLRERSAVSESSFGALPQASAPRRVLIVEDNVDSRDSLRLLLETMGHEVDTAEDGEAGVEKLARLRPEIAFIDIGLPKMDGLQVAVRARALAGGTRCYLVALTGYGRPEDAARTREAGFDAHLVKPVEAGTLARVIEQASP